MSTAEHTPGPWIFEKRAGNEWWFAGNNGAEIVIRAEGNTSYDNFAVLGSSFDSDKNEANALLIAAAPELLAALEELADDIEDRFDLQHPSTNPGMKDAVRNARSAIAKAKGAQ